MRISWLGLLAAVGCGGGSITDLEGIYTVDTWTQNTMGCDVEGASVKAMEDPVFYIKGESIFGTDFVNVETCADEAECKMKANDGDTIHIGPFNFEDGSDSKGWRSHSAFAFNISGQCEGSVTDLVMTSTASTVRIEERTTPAMPFAPSTGDDECPDAKVEAAAAGQVCGRLEVVTATRTSDF